MNKILCDILDEIDQKLICLQIDFNNSSWRKTIPSEAGWYLIKTNTPLAVLKSIGSPEPEHIAHINIPQYINNASLLHNFGIAIDQSGSEDYVIYNGQADNLKARAREHECGHGKTYCLGLSKYGVLRDYRWVFCYITASKCNVLTNNGQDKLLRIAIEQGWRAKHGWPILCRS